MSAAMRHRAMYRTLLFHKTNFGPPAVPTNVTSYQQYTWAPYTIIQWDDHVSLPFEVHIEEKIGAGAFTEIFSYNSGYSGPGDSIGYGGSNYDVASTYRIRIKKNGLFSPYSATTTFTPRVYLSSYGPFSDQVTPRKIDLSDMSDIASFLGITSRTAPQISKTVTFANAGDNLKLSPIDYCAFIYCYTFDFASINQNIIGDGNNGISGSSAKGGFGASGGGGGAKDSVSGISFAGGDGGSQSDGSPGGGNSGGPGGTGYGAIFMDSFWFWETFGGTGGSGISSVGGFGSTACAGGGGGGSLLVGASAGIGGGGGGGGGTFGLVCNHLTNTGGSGTGTLSFTGGNGGDPAVNTIAEPGQGGGGGCFEVYAKRYDGFINPANIILTGGAGGALGTYGQSNSGLHGDSAIFQISGDETTSTLMTFGDSWNTNI